AAGEDAGINVVVLLVRDVEPCWINIKGVRVLHRELTYAQEPGLGSRLIAKLALNLIPDLGQLLVAAQLLARDLGHYFFVGEAEAEVGSFAILEAEHVVAYHRPAPARFPQFPRMQRGQIEFLTDLVHLLAHDLSDLQLRAMAKKEERINAGGKLPHVSRAQKKLMTGHLSVSRGFSQGRNK